MEGARSHDTKARIEREARDAAARGESLNDACPYPFGTADALHFTAIYLLAINVADAAPNTKG